MPRIRASFAGRPARADPDLQVVHGLVEDVLARRMALKRGGHGGTATTPSSVVLFANEPNAGQKCSEGCKQTGRKVHLSRKQLGALKRKWFDAELTAGEAKLKRQWEALPRDPVTQELVAWRYSDLGGASGEDPCMDALKAALDGLISQRRVDANSTPFGFGGTSSPLLEREGFLNARVPHPALIFLEHDHAWAQALASALQGNAAEATADGSAASQTLRDRKFDVDDADDGDPSCGTAAVEASLTDALERYLRLDETESATLWAILHYRVKLQERAVARSLSALDIDRTGGLAAVPASGTKERRGGFEAFLAERGRSRRAEPDDAVAIDHNGADFDERDAEDDPAWVLAAEADFLQLSHTEKAWWLRHAAAAAPGVDFRPNWKPRCECAG